MLFIRCCWIVGLRKTHVTELVVRIEECMRIMLCKRFDIIVYKKCIQRCLFFDFKKTSQKSLSDSQSKNISTLKKNETTRYNSLQIATRGYSLPILPFDPVLGKTVKRHMLAITYRLAYTPNAFKCK